MTSGHARRSFQEEVMQAASEIGLRYKTDRKHADHVAANLPQLFRELQARCTGWIAKYELILRVAATCMKWACSSARVSITSTASTS
jgi:exopolyphosphatase/guanosine-5'-triphosphate,3'-diphosphate pyrophosphatase